MTPVRCKAGHEVCDLVDPSKLGDINGWAAAFGNWRHFPPPRAGEIALCREVVSREPYRECGAPVEWP